MAAGKRTKDGTAQPDRPAAGEPAKQPEVSEPAKHPTGEARRPTVLLAALTVGVAAAALIAHWPALSARALAFDDDKHIFQSPLVQNPSLHSAGRIVGEVLEPSVGGYYKPLSMLSLMLDRAIAGRPDDLRPFRRTSLALHVINTVGVVVLLHLLFGQPWVAALAGLLFGLHPCSVEAIPWTAERKALLSAFFSLWCLVLYVRYTRSLGWGFYAAALGMYLCALLSKPTATPVVALLLLLDYWPIRRLSWRTVAEKVPFLVVGAASAVITVVSQHRTLGVVPPSEESPLRAPLVLGHNIIFYLGKIVWPGELTPHYPYPDPFDLSNPLLPACLLGSMVLVVGLLISWRWTRAPLMGWLFFFVAIFPAIGVVGFMRAIAADRFLYLPSVGLLLVLAWLLCRFWRVPAAGSRQGPPLARRAVIVAVVLMVAVAEARATRRYLVCWRDTESLARRMVALAPNVSIVRAHLAYALGATGKVDEAIEQYTEAIRLRPTNAQAHYNLGVLLDGQGRRDEAAEHYAEAVRIDPTNHEAHTNLGNAFLIRGNTELAEHHYRQALEANPDHAEAHNNLAAVLMARQRVEEAIDHYRRAIRLQPANYKAHNNLGRALVRQGKTMAAVECFGRALEINPDYADGHFRLADVLEKQGETDQAVAGYRQVLRLDSNHLDAHLALARLLRGRGRIEAAAVHLRQAARIKPDSAQIYNEFGLLQVRLGRPAEAVQAFRRAVRSDSNYVDAQINLGKTIRGMGRVQEAVEVLRQAVGTDPDNAEAHFYLGLLLHDQGSLDEAIREYRQVLRLDPQHSDAAEALEMATRETQER